jgi:predicted Fe-S protein YdhL (DUF1289 family)
MTEVASPCINKCCLNQDDICLGCFRTLLDIENWSQLDDSARQNRMAAAQQRQQAALATRQTLLNSQ